MKKKNTTFSQSTQGFLGLVCDAALVLTLPVTGSSHLSVVSLPH